MDSKPTYYQPVNNISQQLFQIDLQNCQKPYGSPKPFTAPACCEKDLKLQSFYEKTPYNLWDTASSYPPNNCIDSAYLKQAVMSQYYNYVSHNNILEK